MLHWYVKMGMALLLALSATACQPHVEGEEDVFDPHMAQQAEPLGTQSTCNDSQLGWPAPAGGSMPALNSGTCSGPWEYSNYSQCYVKRDSSYCPIAGYRNTATCYAPKTCEHPDFGLAYTYDATFTVNVTPVQVVVRRTCEIGPGGKPICYDEYGYSASGPCLSAANAKKAEVDDRYEAGVTVKSYSAAAAYSATPVACTFTLGGYPKYSARADAARCGTAPYSCPNYNDPIYALCRHPNHGLTADPAECYNENPTAYPIETTRQYSPHAMRLDGLRTGASSRAVITESIAGHAPRCTTADNLPARNATEVRAKFDALTNQLTTVEGWINSGTGPATNLPAWRSKLVAFAKRLFEMRGSMLDDAPTATRTNKALKLYTDYPETGFRRVTRVDPVVNFSWGLDSPMAGIPADSFSVRWTGKVIPRFSESYTFHTVTDDGVRLWVNGNLIINKWILQGPTEHTGTISLMAGQEYDIRLEFYENTVGATAQLFWSSPSQVKEIIPSTRLKTAAGDAGAPGLRAEYFDNTKFDNHDITAASDCGNPWTEAPPVDDNACTGAREANAMLGLCRKMLLDHVSAANAAMALNKCIDYIATIQASTCTRDKYTTKYDEFILAMLKKHLVTPHAKTVAEPAESLEMRKAVQRKLAFVDRWYDAYRAHVYGGDKLADGLNQRTSQVLGEFWRGAYMSERPLGMVAEDNLELPPEQLSLDSLPGLSDSYLKVDREVLRAAYSDQIYPAPAVPPMNSLPLLLVTSDAMRGMAQRLENVAASHDLGCRFRGCSGGQVSTEVSQLWRLLSVLPAQSTLTTTLGASTKVNAGWKSAFTAIRDRHTLLQGAVVDALGGSYSATALDPKTAETYPKLANEFIELMRDARRRITSYDLTGAFDSSLRNVLHTGMNSEKQAEINTLLDTAVANLRAEIDDYKRERTTLLSTYLDELRAKQEQDKAMNDMRYRRARMGQLDSDLAGMRHNARTGAARHSDFVQDFEEIASSTTATQFQVKLEGPTYVAVSALDAKYSKPEPQRPTMADDVTALAARGWKLEAQKGDVLRIEIDPADSWAPTCAFASPRAKLPLGSQGALVPIDATGVTTGPEGFTVQLANGKYTASAVTSTYTSGTYESYGISGDICFGMKAGTPFQDLSGSGAYVEMTACAHASHSGQWSETESDSSTAGQERRSSASFTAGLRLPNTPFPHLATGSLLLVEVHRGGSTREKIVQIHPLQRSMNTILIDNAQSDLYLVVNDRACPGASDLELTLAVYRTRQFGEGNLADKLLQSMADAKTSIAVEGKVALREGRISPEKLASLRSDASTLLETSCACNLADYPSHLQRLFVSWVDHELALLSLHADIIASERELSLLAIEAEGFGMDLENSRMASRLLKLLSLSAVRNMEGAELAVRTRELTDVFNRYLFPIIRLRYPEIITTIQADTSASKELMALTDGAELVLPTGPSGTPETHQPAWTRSQLATAEVVLSFVNRVRSALAIARAGSDSSTADFPVLALSFPRPGAHAPGWKSLYNMADEARSAKVWDELEHGVKASFTIQPEDLYGKHGGEKMLCNQGAMVIRSMSLFFSIPGIGSGADTMNWLPQITPTWVNQAMTFAIQGGPAIYEQRNPKWLGTYTYPIFGEPHEAKSKFMTYRRASRKGNGLSPFTTFDISPTALRDWVYQPIAQADEAILVFEVEVEPVATDMQWIKTCKPVPAPAALTPAPTTTEQSVVEAGALL